MKRPAPRPCVSCPYRQDVPSGVWDRTEYLKLPSYDWPTERQHPSMFLCHQQDGRACAGWVAVHDMDESLGLRMAASFGLLSADDVEAIRDYSTDVPLFSCGAEAAAHGLRDYREPGESARQMIARLRRRDARR